MSRISICAAALLLVTVPACSQEMSWSIVDRMITRDFPDVPVATTEELANWMADSSAGVPMLLDVRTEGEYNVSHLAGASRMDPDHPDLGRLDGLPRDTPIVAYCSVGYRSSAMVETLQAAGFTNAYNLRGSLFAWANEGRPVYRGTLRVRDVHPYDSAWGMLLDKSYRTRTPR